MKYFYQKPEVTIQLYGRTISLSHPVYQQGTLYLQDGLGIVVVQQHFEFGKCFWGELDPWLANDIYLNPNFPKFFKENASYEPYVIFELRSLMWSLRMKPLAREPWEEFFGR